MFYSYKNVSFKITENSNVTALLYVSRIRLFPADDKRQRLSGFEFPVVSLFLSLFVCLFAT